MKQSSSDSGKKMAASFIGMIYCCLVLITSVLTIFYTIIIPNKIIFCIILSLISFGDIAAMIYSRRKLLTRICSVVLLPILLPIVLLCFGEWVLIIPLIVTALIVFFLCGCKENIKTIFGTIYLLLYVIGSLIYFLAISLFSTTTVSTTIQSEVSPSGSYRYSLVNTEDSSNGSTAVIIEPNDLDINLGIMTFSAEGYKRIVYIERPIQTENNLEWKAASRQDVTNELLQMYENTTLELSVSDKKTLGYSPDATIYLNSLSDPDLERLGVPQTIDVLYLNGNICFRSYIAILEDYFSASKRAISIFQ